MKTILSILVLLNIALVNFAYAAPKEVDVSYQAVRNGIPFANVHEIFKQENGHYKIESVTQGIGVFALLGKRTLRSEGEVTAQGLKPTHFEQHQGEVGKRSIYNDFDWAAGNLNIKNKEVESTEKLEAGTQDILSAIYQFMFNHFKADDYSVTLTTGKKIGTYRYNVGDRDAVLEVPAGKYKTLHLTNAAEVRDPKEFWLSSETAYLPVKILMHDDAGAKIEQSLTSLHVE